MSVLMGLGVVLKKLFRSSPKSMLSVWPSLSISEGAQVIGVEVGVGVGICGVGVGVGSGVGVEVGIAGVGVGLGTAADTV